MASVIVDLENLNIGEEEQQNNFQTIFDVYRRSNGTCEEASLTRLMLSYLEDLDDPKTMVTFQTVARPRVGRALMIPRDNRLDNDTF